MKKNNKNENETLRYENEKYNVNDNENEKVIDHVQLDGLAMYDMTANASDGERKTTFMFTPCMSDSETVPLYRKSGVAMQMSDGTFEFVAVPRKRCVGTLIKKLLHGRVSATKDGAILLTLKVFDRENINVCNALRREAIEGVEAISKYLNNK